MNLIDNFTQFADLPAEGGTPAPAAFVRRGDFWALAYGGHVVLLRDSKGLHYLAELLRSPGEAVSVAELGGEVRYAAAAADQAALERARSAVTKRIRDALLRIERSHPDLGGHLSARVKTGFQCCYSPDPDQPVLWQL